MRKQVIVHPDPDTNMPVQGVWFRSCCTAEAETQTGLTGWVRNRSDETVEALFVGDDEQVQHMLDWCAKFHDEHGIILRVEEINPVDETEYSNFTRAENFTVTSNS